MSAGRAKAFTKTRACPSSEDVSLSQSFRLPPSKAEKIALHLTGCEFCAAEQSLLFAYPQTTEDCELAEMPSHLRRLAEAVLRETVKQSYKRSEIKGGVSSKDRIFRI